MKLKNCRKNKNFIYHLSETDTNQIKTWLPLLPEYYSESDAAKLLIIFQKAITSAYLEKNDVYELLEYLPRTIPKLHEERCCPKDEQSTNWHVYLDEKQITFKRNLEKLYHLLSNWIFLQNSLCHKDSGTVGNPIDRVPVLGIEQKI